MSQADQAPDKIDEHYRLQLSALLDGALSPDEARFLLRRLQHDEELGDCWARWQLCGDILRGQANVELPERMLPGDFATRVARAITAENDHPAIPSSVAKSSGWLRWGGGAALAASVALVAVMVVRQDPGPAATPADPVEVATTPVPAAPAQDTPAPAPAPASITADTAALAGVAVAATEVPRRANARQAVAQRATGSSRIAAARTAPATTIQPPRDIAASTNPDAATDTTATPMAVAVAASSTAQADAMDGFVLRQPPQSRPWPRALVPTSPANVGFTVGHAGTATVPTFTPFPSHTPTIVIDEGEQPDGAAQPDTDDETDNAPY